MTGFVRHCPYTSVVRCRSRPGCYLRQTHTLFSLLRRGYSSAASALAPLVGRVLRVGLLAQLVPVALGDINAVVFGRLLDVAEGKVAIRVGDTLYLIEAGQRVLNVRGVGQRLLALPGEGVGAIGQLLAVLIAQVAVFGVGLLCRMF